MYDGMLSIYICMWFGPTFCLVMLLFFSKNQVGNILFLIMEILQILFSKFQSICVELYLNTCGQIRVKSQCSDKSRGKFARANLSFVNNFYTITGSSRSRGNLKLSFNKVRVKMH
jgi:hypothetical protein